MHRPSFRLSSLEQSQILSLIVILGGALVLLGWATGSQLLTRLIPGFIAMKANTALCFVLFGLAGLLSISSGRWTIRLGFVFLLVGTLIALLTLGEIAFRWDFGIDELLFLDTMDPLGTTSPGQMAVLTALSFSLLGLVSLLRAWVPTRFRILALFAVVAIAVSGFVSYPFSLVSGSGLYSASGMALHTALLFLLLGFSHLRRETSAGWMGILFARTPLGDNTRSVLATVVLSPFILGWIIYTGETAGWFNAGVARLYFSISVMLLLAIVVLYNAQRLYEAEQMHRSLASNLESVQRQMLTLVENSPAGIFVKTLDGRYDLVNSRFEAIVGRPRSQIVGKRTEALFKGDLLVALLESDRSVVETKDTVVSELKVDFEGTTRTYLNTKFPLLDDQGIVKSIGGIWTDISDQKALAEDLKTKNTDLERSNKELEQFAYVASHDLQEPLRMVSSYMQLLESRYKDKLDADAAEFIGYAVDGASRMQRLIQDLLAFSRVGTRGKIPEPVETNVAVQEALMNLKVRIEETGAEIRVEDLPVVLADKNQLVQVFQNLVSNAIKFMGEKKPELTISAKPKEGYAEFSVKDQGIGFDQKHAERIFILFQRLNNRAEYEGTGIGLAVCKKIVERHGGRIWAESQPGRGSTFRFTFPLAPQVEPAPPGSESGDGMPKEKETFEERAGRLI